ncbi:AlpA family transcriptional regulator [Duganella sp. HSC-15S17]|uniref:AlpA family transcriptional regulator n=2 Tax=Duganella violaceipulchra TaxID=2849652 RepID=A0AA41HGI3_9BURK|nr:AlpA family transcriptional regulator [Duganella violaceicalia]
MTVSFQKPPTILRRKQVEARTGLSRSTIYDKMNPRSPRYDFTFPKQIRLGEHSVGWVESQIDAWLISRIRYSQPR